MEVDETTQDGNVNSLHADNNDSNQCPVCKKKELNNVLLHISRTKKCKEAVSEAQMEELKRVANEKRKAKKRVSDKTTQDVRARKYREKNPDAGMKEKKHPDKEKI